MYSTDNPQRRSNRLSAYAFKLSAGVGAGADWQPISGLLQAHGWLHVVGEYTTRDQPSTCPNTAAHPGSIDIWVNGVRWNQAVHNPTGCMSQPNFEVTPRSASSRLNIATMAHDSWFLGAIGKVAIYNSRLSQSQITAHYRAMTGHMATGSCADMCLF